MNFESKTIFLVLCFSLDDVVAKETYSILRMVFIRFSMFISIFNLIAMTVDRYFSIFHPIKHRNRSRNFVRIVIGVAWGLSFFSVALLYCITRWFVAKSYTGLVTLIFPILSYPATVVFVYCYTAIYMWIRQRGRADIKSEVGFHFFRFISKILMDVYHSFTSLLASHLLMKGVLFSKIKTSGLDFIFVVLLYILREFIPPFSI